jgi:hypothetical protein
VSREKSTNQKLAANRKQDSRSEELSTMSSVFQTFIAQFPWNPTISLLLRKNRKAQQTILKLSGVVLLSNHSTYSEAHHGKAESTSSDVTGLLKNFCYFLPDNFYNDFTFSLCR